ncbi:MAG: DUF5996 family protein [Chloroflexi bacterium]|nr:DUF5996 family protein [Chloroflexota bacterium]
MTESTFPPLSNWASTRDTLSHYAAAIGVVPRALADPHPKWWHISLKVQEQGAATDLIPLPGSDGETFHLLMNLRNHTVDVSTSEGELLSLSMTEGLSSSEFGNRLLSLLGDLGIEAEYERAKFENEEPRAYDPQAAGLYRIILLKAAEVLELHRSGLNGETGPVQLWPHDFDLAFEWFGTLAVPSVDDGDAREQPSQINFGLTPGDRSHSEAYFYSNPWPFQDSLIERELPNGARWFTEGWQGTLLPYAEIAGSKSGADKLAAYFRAVYDLASPLLTA